MGGSSALNSPVVASVVMVMILAASSLPPLRTAWLAVAVVAAATGTSSALATHSTVVPLTRCTALSKCCGWSSGVSVISAQPILFWLTP